MASAALSRLHGGGETCSSNPPARSEPKRCSRQRVLRRPTTMEISKPRPGVIKGPRAVSLVNADQTLPGQIPGPLGGSTSRCQPSAEILNAAAAPARAEGSLSLRTSLALVRSPGPGPCRDRSLPREGEAIRVTDILPRPPIPAAAAGDRWARSIRVAARGGRVHRPCAAAAGTAGPAHPSPSDPKRVRPVRPSPAGRGLSDGPWYPGHARLRDPASTGSV
jgi:hypothetical protein